MDENDNFIQVRCKICRSILFEADPQARGRVRKKCQKCKQFRTVILPLTGAPEVCSILPNAGPDGSGGKRPGSGPPNLKK